MKQRRRNRHHQPAGLQPDKQQRRSAWRTLSSWCLDTLGLRSHLRRCGPNGYSMHLKNAPTILGILLSGSSVTLHSLAPDMDISGSFDLNSRQKYYNWMICQVLSLILAVLFPEPLKRRVPDVRLVCLMGN